MPTSVAVDGTVAVVTLSSADGLNRLSRALLGELATALYDCERNSAVRGIVLTAEGRTFSAGADIDEFPYGQDADGFLHEVLGLLSTPERIAKPIVAVVERSAMAGGLELALSCDWIVAAADARLGLPEVQLGFMPGYCMSRLPSLVGEARARRLMLDPGPYTPAELATLGVHVSSPPDGRSVLEEAMTICTRMSVGAPTSIRLVKAMTNRLVRSPDFEPVIAAYNYLFQLPAASEGLAAFREHRAPDFWSGRQ